MNFFLNTEINQTINITNILNLINSILKSNYSSLEDVDENNNNVLMILLLNNKTKNINLSLEEFFFIIKNSNINKQNIEGNNALILSIKNNLKQSLNFTEEIFEYLIKNTNLKNYNINQVSPLMFYFSEKEKENIRITNLVFDYFFDNSDLFLKSVFCPYLILLDYLSDKNTITLSDEQLKKLYKTIVVLNKSNLFNIQEMVKFNNNSLLLEKLKNVYQLENKEFPLI